MLVSEEYKIIASIMVESMFAEHGLISLDVATGELSILPPITRQSISLKTNTIFDVLLVTK